MEVTCVGDVMMAHGMKSVLAEKGADYPFQRVKILLKKSDVVFGNLENPISARGNRYPDKDFHFLMDPPSTPALRQAGFRVMSLANNHTLDFGPDALRDTLLYLKQQNILTCGAGENLEDARKPAVVVVRKKRVAFLAYSRTFPLSFSADDGNPGTAFAEESFIREDVARAKKSNTWVIVSFHWGEEYSSVPTPIQRQLAHAAIDAGADAVIGHHPHVAQGIEIYKKRIIAYSLGNFVFGTRNPNADEGLVLKLHLRTGRPPRAEIFPIDVDNSRIAFRPQPLKNKPLKQSLSRLKALSADLGTRLRTKKDRAVLP